METYNTDSLRVGPLMDRPRLRLPPRLVGSMVADPDPVSLGHLPRLTFSLPEETEDIDSPRQCPSGRVGRGRRVDSPLTF